MSINEEVREIIESNIQILDRYQEHGFSPILVVDGQQFPYKDLDEDCATELLGTEGCGVFTTIGGNTRFLAIKAMTSEAFEVVVDSLPPTTFCFERSDKKQRFYLYTRGERISKRVAHDEIMSPCGTAKVRICYNVLIPLPNILRLDGEVEYVGLPAQAGATNIAELKQADLENLSAKTSHFFGQIKPIPALRLQAKPTPPSFYPEALAPAILDAAPRLKTHPEYIAAAMLTALSRVIGKKVKLQNCGDNEDLWVYPGGYTAIIGRPGSNKDGSMKVIWDVLAELKKARAEKFKNQIEVYEGLKRDAKIQFAALDDAIKRATLDEVGYGSAPAKVQDQKPKKLTKEELQRKKDEIEKQLLERRVLNLIYTVEDVNRERMEEDHVDNPDGLLIWFNELSRIFDELRTPNGYKWREALQKGWTGREPQSTRRMSRLVDISEFSLTLVGGTQPDTYQKFIADELRYGKKGDGLEARIQKVYPNYRPPRSSDAIKKKRNEVAWKRAVNAFKWLDSEFHLLIEPNAKGTITLRLSSSAQVVYDQWFSANERMAESWAERNELFNAFIDKAPIMAARFALSYHCIELADQWAEKEIVRRNAKEISESTLRQALAWTDRMLDYAKIIYLQASNPEITTAVSIYDKIRRGLIRYNANIREEIIKGDFPDLKVEKDVYAAIAILEKCNIVRLNKVESSSGKGRKAKHLLINTKVLEEVAQELPVSEQLGDEEFEDKDQDGADPVPTEHFESRWMPSEEASDREAEPSQSSAPSAATFADEFGSADGDGVADLRDPAA